MTKTLHARYDGKVFLPHPQEEIPIPPETDVQITVEVQEAMEEHRPGKTGVPYSFLDVALSNPLDGPPDWAENLDEYLYGGRKLPE
jgi:hypothetical protein